MHYSKVKAGMKIKITKMDTTHRIHNSNHNMKKMVGKRFTIREVENSHKQLVDHPYIIRLKPDSRGYAWDPEDLEKIGPPIIIPKSGTFDPKNLIL